MYIYLVFYEWVGSVQHVEEGSPHRLFVLPRVLTEDLHSRFVFLELYIGLYSLSIRTLIERRIQTFKILSAG